MPGIQPLTASSYQDCLAKDGLVTPASQQDRTGRAEYLKLGGCSKFESRSGLDYYCCPPLRVRSCPDDHTKHHVHNVGEWMNEPCFDTGMVQRAPYGTWGRVWCCPPRERRQQSVDPFTQTV